ncbi:MAG: hypothetical protein AAF479_13650, partial [Pseudomonadota bacterium]
QIPIVPSDDPSQGSFTVNEDGKMWMTWNDGRFGNIRCEGINNSRRIVVELGLFEQPDIGFDEAFDTVKQSIVGLFNLENADD